MKVFAAPLLVSAALAVIGSFIQVDAHSWLTKPVSRETSASGADLTNKMACPNKTPGKSTSFKAGETIDVRYWRNNHLGGFIRWSLVPKGKETKADFDSSANIFHYSCRESGPECLPKGNQATNMYADDGADENTIPCGDKIALPDHLPAGDYVLQWTWFGVGSDYGNIAWEESMFRSCADIKLTTAGTKSAAPKCPTFTGGDRATKLQNQGNDKCFYFYRTEIANTQYKGDNNNYKPLYKFGIPAAIENCSGGSGGSNSTTPAPSSSTSKPAVTTVTPGTKAPGTKAPTPAATTKAPGTKSPVTTTKAPGTKVPSPTRRPRPRPSSTRTPKPTSGDVGGDADDDESVIPAPSSSTSTPAPSSKAPDCKVKGKGNSSKY